MARRIMPFLWLPDSCDRRKARPQKRAFLHTVSRLRSRNGSLQTAPNGQKRAHEVLKYLSLCGRS